MTLSRDRGASGPFGSGSNFNASMMDDVELEPPVVIVSPVEGIAAAHPASGMSRSISRRVVIDSLKLLEQIRN
jgi:hypothetical protein